MQHDERDMSTWALENWRAGGLCFSHCGFKGIYIYSKGHQWNSKLGVLLCKGSILHRAPNCYIPMEIELNRPSKQPRLIFQENCLILMLIMEIVLHVRPNKKNLDCMYTWKKYLLCSSSQWILGNFLKLLFSPSACFFNNPFSLKTIPSAMTSFQNSPDANQSWQPGQQFSDPK